MAQTDSNHHKHGKNQPRRPAAAAAPAADSPAIGFNELRQACEISALREDLARLSEDAGALCDHIESGVERVRDRVAGLCAEELADPDVMAPLLQFAVGTLIAIRDRARALDVRSGANDDDDRPDWTSAAPPLAAAPPPPSPPPYPSAQQDAARPRPSSETPKPPPAAASRPPPPPPRPLTDQPLSAPGASWLAPPAPALSPIPAPPRPPPQRAAPAGPVDWLSPARK